MVDRILKAGTLLAAAGLAVAAPVTVRATELDQGVRTCATFGATPGSSEKLTYATTSPVNRVDANSRVFDASAPPAPQTATEGLSPVWDGDDPMRTSAVAVGDIEQRRFRVAGHGSKTVDIGAIQLVSLGRDGEPANGTSCMPRFSADGRTILFASEASNLATSGEFAVSDKSVLALQVAICRSDCRGRIYISRNPATGEIGNGDSSNLRIAPDGRSGVFESLATNLVNGDTNGEKDIFRFELDASLSFVARLNRVSVSPSGTQGNGPSFNASITGDGGIVTFETSATNLVVSSVINAPVTLVKDVASGALVRIQTSDGQPPDGVIAEPVTAGSDLLFTSDASNLALDESAAHIGPKTGTRPRQAYYVVSERRARYVSKNPATGESGNGDSFNVAITPDARYGVFESLATNLVPGDNNNASDIFRFELADGQVVGMQRVSMNASGAEANGPSRNASISADGQTIVFETDATNLVGGDSNNAADVVVRYLPTGEFMRLPRGIGGAEPNGSSGQPEISPDGSTVAFASLASNIAPGDSNGLQDVFSVNLMNSGPADEPRLAGFALPTPNPANANCPSGFFSAVVDDGPGTGLTAGAFGMEVLLDEPGTRVLAGGLNFGGLIDAGQVGFAGFTIANAANESQRLNLSLTGSPSTGSTQSLPVRIRIARRTATTSETVFESTQTISLASAYVTSIDLPPAFYEATVAPVSGSAGGTPEGQFFFSLTTSFINRPGGGFQGGAVVGGYHATHPFGGVSGFAAFCLATPHSTTIRVLSQPSYGPTGAKDLRLRIQDAQQRDVVVVPAG